MSAIQFRLVFSQTWLWNQCGKGVLPVDWFVSEIKKKYSVSEITTKLTECEGRIELPEHESTQLLSEELNQMIKDAYHLEDDKTIYTIEFKNCAAAQEPTVEESITEESITEESITEELAAEEQKTVAAMDRIRQLVGADAFKALAQECVNVAEELKKNQTLDTFTSRSYIISVNSGYGLTTYLKLFADLIEELGLFSFSAKTKVAEVSLAAPGERAEIGNAFSGALSFFQERSGGRVVCIDISEWMTKLSDKEFRNFLKKIDERAGENIVFFRIPFVERNIINDIGDSLNDILFVKALSIAPFSAEELAVCADNIISKRNFTMGEDAWDVFNQRVIVEKSDGRFYGVNTINKIVREMLYEKQLYNVDNAIHNTEIKGNEIRKMVDAERFVSKDGYQQLSGLVGMEKIQEQVREIVAQIKVSMNNCALDAPCIHMRFVGNPGTGKTTVARILGTILKEEGILRNGSFFEYTGRDLCGRYVGETAPKTAAICRDAYGSVLFIDEAYALYRDDGMSHADYGVEALDTLVAEMENHRTDLMVIMAGYPDDMDQLMKGNVGLRSRMPYVIEFPDYSRQQLSDIFMNMVDKGFSYDEAFAEAVRSYFDNLKDEMINAKGFSNARFVRNLFERTWGKAALRCQMSQMICDTLLVEDFALAASDKEFNNILEQKKRTIGFK